MAREREANASSGESSLIDLVAWTSRARCATARPFQLSSSPQSALCAIVVLRRDEEVAGHVVGERATVNDGDVDLIG